MKEINIKDPWSVTVEENNIGESIKWDSTSSFTIAASIPKTVGCWRISGNFHVNVIKRPNRLNRAMARLLLGWEWVDG